MKDAMTTTTTRMITLSRLVLALAVVFLLGVMLMADVDAKKNTGRKPTSIADRVKKEKTLCESNGGKIYVMHSVGSATSTCIGGTHDGRECTHTKQSTVCTQAQTEPPSSPPTDVGGPPINGGNEDPTGGGGTDPGAGGGIDPGPGAEPGASDGDEVRMTSYDGDMRHEAKHDGKRKHRRHDDRSR